MQNKKVSKKRGVSIVKWSWVILVLFFVLSYIDISYGIVGIIGLFGFVCATVPIILASIGKGRMHCSHICPRGSFFTKFMPFISMKRPLPYFMKRAWFKLLLMAFMMGRFIWSIIVNWSNPTILAASIFQFMFMSFIAGTAMGIFFTPRSWCQVCPMGQVSHYIDKGLYHKTNKANKTF
jgi:hypothetical protein